jgi:hypothetical protein
MQRDESIDDMVIRRNKRLLSFFTVHGFNARIVGDNQKPSVILNEEVVLSCYVKNFDLYFTREPFSDDIVRSFKLKEESEVTKLELQEAIELCTHRHAYKIKLSGTDLFLVGFNYFDNGKKEEKYPVFGMHKPKVYFDMEFAVKLVENLCNDDYSVVIV